MNYISQLKTFANLIQEDSRFTCQHVSLYYAILHYGNAAHFQKSFSVHRDSLMQFAKIGSVNTYTRCMKELHSWGLIDYQPSKSMFVASRVTMIKFDHTPDYSSDHSVDKTPDRTDEMELRPFIELKNMNNLKNLNKPNEFKEVEDFFKEEGLDFSLALAFFKYYEARNWKAGTSAIANWKALALYWTSNAQKFKSHEKSTSNSRRNTSIPIPGHLSAPKPKQYNEPL